MGGLENPKWVRLVIFLNFPCAKTTRTVQVQNKGDGLVQNIGNTLIKVFGSDKLLDALEKEWTYGSTDGVCVESVAGG
jgi:hypothetical protein